MTFLGVEMSELFVATVWPSGNALGIEPMESVAKLEPNDVYVALERALSCSQAWAKTQKTNGGKTISNSDRSARFLSDAVQHLHPLFRRKYPETELESRFISIDNEATRHTGEWLLDATWTEDVRADKRVQKRFPTRLRCALECESGTSADAFFIDFSKLVISACQKIDIYLNPKNKCRFEIAKSFHVR